MTTPAEFKSAASSEARINERELVNAFVISSKRERLIFLLAHKENRRRKVALDSLNHFRDLNLRFARQLPLEERNAEAIERLLRQKGTPATCYVISDNWSIDGQFLPLNTALVEVVAGGLGTFLSCLPGKLGYFEGEDIGQRFILEKHSS